MLTDHSDNSPIVLSLIRLGLVHLTEDAARVHLDALLSFTERDEIPTPPPLLTTE